MSADDETTETPTVSLGPAEHALIDQAVKASAWDEISNQLPLLIESLKGVKEALRSLKWIVAIAAIFVGVMFVLGYLTLAARVGKVEEKVEELRPTTTTFPLFDDQAQSSPTTAPSSVSQAQSRARSTVTSPASTPSQGRTEGEREAQSPTVVVVPHPTNDSPSSPSSTTPPATLLPPITIPPQVTGLLAG